MPETRAALREGMGRPLLAPGNPAGAAIARSSPTRVFASALARLEVHQPIRPRAAGRRRATQPSAAAISQGGPGNMPPDRRCRLVYTAVSAYIPEHDSKRAAQRPPWDDKTRTELEAAAFRRLVAHLQERTDVQNIDLMNLAGFLPQLPVALYREEAGTRGIEIADPKAREIVYGMPYEEWKAKAPERGLGRPEEGLRQGQHKHG